MRSHDKNNFIRGLLLMGLFTTALAIPMLVGSTHEVKASAQSETPATFELISIRPSSPERSAGLGPRGGGGAGGGPCAGSPPQVDPARITFNNSSLYSLITFAYGLDCRDGLVSGGPEWARSSTWVIQALIPAGTGFQLHPTRSAGTPFLDPIVSLDPKLQRMLQNLLATRFKLAVHRETRSIQMFKLTVAKDGPKLERPDDVPCNPVWGAPVTTGGKPRCNFTLHRSMTEFLAPLRGMLDRPIIDDTHITGTFEFRMIFAFEPPGGSTRAAGVPPTDPALPSFFTALQEQLGLKLEGTRGPAEAFVIDQAEMPEAN